MKKILFLLTICSQVYAVNNATFNNVFVRDSLWFDGVSFHPVNYYTKTVNIDSIESKISQYADSSTSVTVSGTPVAGQIATFTSATEIGGTDSLKRENGGLVEQGNLTVNGNANLNGILFTGSTKTAGAEYTGTADPTSTNRKNYDGYFHSTALYADGGLINVGGAIQLSSSTGITMLGSGRGEFENEVSSATNPIFVLNQNDKTTGIGGTDAYVSGIVDGVEELRIKPDTVKHFGQVRYEDTFWEDLSVSSTDLGAGVNAPSKRTFIGGIPGYAYNFQTADDESWGIVQTKHAYKPGTNIKPHTHCAIETPPSAGDSIYLMFETACASRDSMYTIVDTFYIQQDVSTWTAKQHKTVSLGTIIGAKLTESAIIKFRILRLQSSPKDTYDSANDWLFIDDVDFHFEMDKPGSNNEIP